MGEDFEFFMRQMLRQSLDPQAMSLYSAEDDVFYGTASAASLRLLKPEVTKEQALALWDQVKRSELAQREWPKFVAAPTPPIKFPKVGEPVTGPDDLMAEAESGRTDILNRIVFYQDSGTGMTRNNILHEMAHVIVLDTFGFAAFQKPRLMQGHGVEFAEVYLALVKNFLPDKAPALEQSFEKWHVNYKEAAK